MSQQLLHLWQDTFLAGFPVVVWIMAFQTGGFLALGLLKCMATRNGIVYRDGVILVPAWTGGMTSGLLIYQLTDLWPGLLTLLYIGTVLFAYWSCQRLKRLISQ